ncbi:MAG: type II toxin-antitoxin system ParD family antitoxin [Methylocystaceae bacterium]|nr:MAG: type II toxin-antitoxin system ParD family antitoxin [Methylocystaceae bacterium]
MNVSVGKHWEEFIDSLVKQGRYASATEVMREGLRLVEEREAKLRSLRETIEASIAEGGAYSSEEVRDYLEKKRVELKARGLNCDNSSIQEPRDGAAANCSNI